MSDGLYEILALAARYFFAGLFLLIVFRAWRITVRDGRRARKLRRYSPETGLCGELVVIEGDEKARRGMRYPVIREGVIGSGRFADVRIRHSSIRKIHARFEWKPDGLHIRSDGSAKIFASDGTRARSLVARDGDRFTLGSVQLLLVLLDGESGNTPATASEEDDLFLAPPVSPARQPNEGAASISDRPDPDAALYGCPSSRDRFSERNPENVRRRVDEIFDLSDDELFRSDDEDGEP